MVTITTERATRARWDDVQHSLTGGGDGRSCQCVWPILRNKDWNTTTVDDRTALFHDEIDAGPPPGLVAYVDGEAAGWIRIGPRTAQLRIPNTKAIAAATHEPLDDPTVWAVTCFVVRREHRGQGLTSALLRSAIEYAHDSGARIIEGYPVDTSHGRVPSNDLFHGALPTFLNEGFQQIAPLTRGRVLVSRATP
ncbi:GNAT family N-acetyltransferase [Microbacterium istanbulense]|uniref:GNAT family N-acetyltransferase n=1 Tax=Microbacterium istanbulense TaxID=3122049 RepID=A0ABU8LR45_9MICO